jgi:hypothetical protein
MTPVLFALILQVQDPAPSPVPAVETPPSATAPAAPAAADDESRVICVIETQTGSYFSKKTCLTKAQWKKRRESRRGNAERALAADTDAGTGN